MQDKIFSGQRDICQLINQLSDPEDYLRKQAAALLKAHPDRRAVLDGYLDFLKGASQELSLLLLGKIERDGRGMGNIAPRILPLIYSSDYRLRAKAFIAIARIGDSSVGGELMGFMAGRPGEEWQLRALDCFYHFRDRTWIRPLSGFLNRGDNPLLVRGTLWLTGSLGGVEAIGIIAHFAASPQGRLVKDEIMLEALRMAVDSCPEGREILDDLWLNSPQIGRALRYAVLPCDEEPRFNIYPYPDYLLDQARAHGLSADEFRRLSFWDRS